MNKAVLHSLTEAEGLLVRETEPGALAELDEDELLDLHVRVRRARTKYAKLYRRAAAAAVDDRAPTGAAAPPATPARGPAGPPGRARADVSRRRPVA